MLGHLRSRRVIYTSSRFCCRPFSEPTQGLQKAKTWYQFVRGVVLGDGRHTRLWQDVWVGDCNLKTCFPKLYNISIDQQISVEEANSGGWNLRFRRSLAAVEAGEWSQLRTSLVGRRFRDRVTRWSGNWRPKDLILPDRYIASW
jgi:hypothetical protein